MQTSLVQWLPRRSSNGAGFLPLAACVYAWLAEARTELYVANGIAAHSLDYNRLGRDVIYGSRFVRVPTHSPRQIPPGTHRDQNRKPPPGDGDALGSPKKRGQTGSSE